MTDQATLAQNKAARPDVSTWLTANAGSGKTRVLTDRVARLLLRGVLPQNILCLTYTKAAASEMQNRLFKTLGSWAMLDDASLARALEALGEAAPKDLGKARTLFAAAIEAPGGLKIQTIHSLCSIILRQFPLEAGVTPNFQEIDDAGKKQVVDHCLEALAVAHPDRLELTAKEHPSGLADLAKEVIGKAGGFREPVTRKEIFRVFEVPEDKTDLDIIQEYLTTADISFLRSMVSVLLNQGSANDHKLAHKIQALPDTVGDTAFSIVESCVLTKDGVPPKRKIITNKVSSDQHLGPLLPEIEDLTGRIVDARNARASLKAANRTYVIHEFARLLLPAYEREKAYRGVLDFDDLITKTKDLLTDRSLEWVLYKLDGRIEHILVDEAQDTGPAQWDVIEALAAEMTSGQGDRDRTLFVVGDKKQSIYSFQGADAAGFDQRGKTFRSRLADGPGMQEGALLYSFRSSTAILQAVDAVFANNPSLGEDEQSHHIAFHQDMPGRVDFWPLVEPPEQEDLPAWFDTRYTTVAQNAPVQLAEKVAETIEALLKSGTIPRKDGGFRRIQAGDILVLVQRRSALFDRIIAACKGRDLPMAGADRLKVGSELAVRDILALLSFLALPEDCLSLAAALRSPLFGWDEQDLFSLAAKRPKNRLLWAELRDRKGEFSDTHAKLEALRALVDFARPFELIDTILSEFRGRQNLLERLGPEAEEGIDELLNQALAYETADVPSLTGFLAEARSSETDIKREADSTGNAIRVMTVHGAKGLESPVVILPDTTFERSNKGGKFIKGPNNLTIMTGNKGTNPSLLDDALEAQKNADAAERDRLLYVAMTRAENWLIVCGVKGQKTDLSGSWFGKVEAGLLALNAESYETPTGPGLRLQHGDWSADVTAETEAVEDPALSPRCFGPAPPADKSTKLLAPSDLGGAKTTGTGALDEAEARQRGRQIHRLLEHMRDANDVETGRNTLAQMGADAPAEADIPALLDEAKVVLTNHPDLFAGQGLAEVEITGFSPTANARISGTIDLLVVKDDRIMAIDFKTNAGLPSTPDDTPESIKRQMGAYLECLEAIYPDKAIDLAVLWTKTADLMPLKHVIVREALQRYATS